MTKPILIVGGGPAGLAAAHSLATFGQSCILVEKEDRLGGGSVSAFLLLLLNQPRTFGRDELDPLG